MDVQTFFLRLGQKIIHLLTARMVSGQLYEVDMRLRPSGNSGLLVTSLKAFEKYQLESAWTWEHQALIRARPIAGSKSIADQFQSIRRSVLSRPRDNAKLLIDIEDMRNKMRKHLWIKTDTEFDLKQAPGGIVDIEFMVQYAVLKCSEKFPDTLEFTDNVRLLEKLGQAGVFSKVELETLQAAYIAMRSKGHERALQNQSLSLDVSSGSFQELLPHIESVKKLWNKLFQTSE